MYYDVAIVGMGPAGATFARLLGKKYKTVIIDKKIKGKFEKPCGGLLSSDAQRALSQFDITLPKEILVSPQIFAVKTIDMDTGKIRHYPRAYFNMDRNKFDFWLSSMVSDNIEKRFGHCLFVKRLKCGFLLKIKEDNNIFEIKAKYVIGADGANSVVRRSLFPNKKLRSYVAIQQWFNEKNSRPFYSCVFDSKTTDCCSWSISKDSFFIFGGAFPAKDCRKNFEIQKKKLKEYGFEFGTPLKTEACMVLRPRTPFDFCCGENGAFLLGEAAGFISPSSLEGISWGINSGKILANIFNSDISDFNREYNKKTFSIKTKLSFKLLKCPFMYSPKLRNIVLKSGIGSIDMNR